MTVFNVNALEIGGNMVSLARCAPRNVPGFLINHGAHALGKQCSIQFHFDSVIVIPHNI